MFPTSRDQATGDGDLEQRLRGLILNNSGANLDAPAPAPAPSSSAPLPPHMLGATPDEQQAYRATQNSQPQAQPSSKSPEQNVQPGKKRLNQAQRRQMNSNLSIPIDTRPIPNTQADYNANSHLAGNHAPKISPQYGYQQPHQNQRYPQQQQSYSPRFQNKGQGSPYSPRGSYSQGGSQQYQQGQAQFRQAPNNYRQQQSPGFQSPAYGRPPTSNRQLYQPGGYSGQGRGRPYSQNADEISVQISYLTNLLQESVPTVAIDETEEAEKDAFRALVENSCREAIALYEREDLSNPSFNASTVELKCFGSMSSGYATKASDMDLALLTPHSNPPADSSESTIPRLLEKKLLDLGYGARLLTRTRVPIIKLCQKPTEKLLKDLLVERTKWEQGFNDVVEEGGQPALDFKGSEEEVESPTDTDMPQPFPPAGEPAPQKKMEQTPKLKQKDNQSFGDYYNRTKRLLRKLGGRDVTASSPDLTEEEGNILNDVCKAFVSGLKSGALVTQLRGYQTISHLFDPSLPFVQRTLSGVWTQIDGERLAMAFKDRPLKESNDQRENECRSLVEAWRLLQDKVGPIAESLHYNRQLYLAADKLKHISSLQLLFLEQAEYERPTFYHAKATKLLYDLIGRDQERTVAVTPYVVAYYIAGIHDTQIKDEIQTLARDNTHPSGVDTKLTIDVVSLQHRVLQLASDYENAVKKELFDEADCSLIKQYVALLRSRPLEGFSTAITEANTALIGKMHTLSDPALLSANKPRDRYHDHLEFPKTDIGIQCDINFSANLALHNTLLLRCYSHSDPRVKQLILFVKHWAKLRGVNTPYRGSLSSYGYVLMVLHYLVNVAQPFVCPNLQLLHRDPPPYLPPAEIEARTTCQGRDVRFWRNEVEIGDLASRGLLNHNKDSLGSLIRGFFEYYAQGGQMSTVLNRGFDWGREVLSLRTPGGILSKQEKGWTGARTVTETTIITAPSTSATPAHPRTNVDENEAVAPISDAEVKPKLRTVEETKEIRHRYLFAIEDPFELDHNVARTVTHSGIVSIRDELRRAWRIIQGLGKNNVSEGLLDAVITEDAKSDLQDLLNQIHGRSQ
jgi:terminal uridylyltransferase